MLQDTTELSPRQLVALEIAIKWVIDTKGHLKKQQECDDEDNGHQGKVTKWETEKGRTVKKERQASRQKKAQVRKVVSRQVKKETEVGPQWRLTWTAVAHTSQATWSPEHEKRQVDGISTNEQEQERPDKQRKEK